ncbi:MAG TPA: SH3 domain-containing protein [Anaerolineales bacterium]
MFKPAPSLALAVLMIAIAACSPATVPTPDANSVNTAVAQTLVAIQIQSAQPGIPVTGPGTATPTSTPEPPTPSPTITLSPTPVFTSTPLVPQISVSVPTNCRVGPGKAYGRVGALLVGEVTEVFGRDLAGNYWYVRNPDSPNNFCWLWGEYATLSGNIQVLPVYTPPPTPTPVPAFVASYSGLEFCIGWWVEIKLENTGGIPFQSILMAVADSSTNTTISISENKFTNINGCNASDSRNVLASGEKLTVSSPVFGYDPTGHALRGTITLCSEDGINGTCVTQVIEFKP